MDSSSRYQLQQQHQPNSGLLRFRSAPSSVGANFKHGEGGAANNGNNNNNPWENFEPAERLVLRFMDSGESNDTASPSNNKAANESSSSLSRMNSQQGYSTTISGASSSMLQVGSMGMDHPKSFNSHLLRQSSFPAGHFSNVISFENGVGNYGGANGSDGELSLSMNTLKNQIGFSQRSPSSLGMLSSQTSKMGSEGIGTTGRDDGRQVGGNGDARYFGPKFPYHSYDQNGELGNQVHTLSHHLSLPRKSSEMFVMENLLQFPDPVPSGIRAKRGFATHPRSIAERVRRTRISERIRKLQELVPNIDKQTSTADMLDLAVEYIQDLQKQFKTLSEKRAKCKCISMQKSETNQIA